MPLVVKSSSAIAESSMPNVPAMAIGRRGRRSATCPAYSATAMNGSASASPIMPSDSGSRVTSNTCQPTTTICASRATVDVRVAEDQPEKVSDAERGVRIVRGQAAAECTIGAMRFTKMQIAYALLHRLRHPRGCCCRWPRLPPYAGLDEVYHVARLAFVRAEHRNPTTSESSIPPYLIGDGRIQPPAPRNF